MANPTTASVDRDLLREQQRQARQFRETSQLPYFQEPQKVAPSRDDALCHQIKQTLGEYESMRETIVSNPKNLIGIARGSSAPHEQPPKLAAPPNGARKNVVPAVPQGPHQVVKGSALDDVSGNHRRDKPKHRIRVNGHGTTVHPAYPPPLQPPPPPSTHPPNGAIMQNGIGKSRKSAVAHLPPPVIVETSKPQPDQCEQLDSILKEMKAPAPLTGIPTPNKEGTVFPFPGPGTPMLSKEKEMKDKGRMVAVVHPHVEDPPSPPSPANRDILNEDLEISEESDSGSISCDLKKTVVDHNRVDRQSPVASSPSGSSGSEEDSTSVSDTDEGSCSKSPLSPLRPESPKDPPSWDLRKFMLPHTQPVPPLPSSSSSCSSSSSLLQPPEVNSSPPEVATKSPSKPRKPLVTEFAPESISAKVERRLQSPSEPSITTKSGARASAKPMASLRNGFVKKERRKSAVHDAPSKEAPRRRTTPEIVADGKAKKSSNAPVPILARTPSPIPNPTPVYKSREFVYDSSSPSCSPSPSPSPCPSPSARDESESESIVDVVGTPSPVKMAPDMARSARRHRMGPLLPLSPKTKVLSPMQSPPPKVSAHVPALPRPPASLVVRLDLALIERVPMYPPLDLDLDVKTDAVPISVSRSRQGHTSGPRSIGTPLKQATPSKGPCTPPTPHPDNCKSASTSSSLKRKSSGDDKDKTEGKRPKLVPVQPESHKKPKHRTKDTDVKPNKDRKKKAKSVKDEPQAPSSASSSEHRVTSSTLDTPPVSSKGRPKNEEGKTKRKKVEDVATIRTNREHKVSEKAVEPVAVKKEPATSLKPAVNPFVTSTPTVVTSAVAPATSRSKQRSGESEPKRRKREPRPPGQPVGPEPPKKASDSPVRNTNHDRQGSSASTSGTSSIPVNNGLAPAPTPPPTPRSGHSSVSGNTSSPAPPDFRERPCIDPDERMHSSDYYLGEAKALKHEADKEANKTAQAMKYLDAVLYFILTGHAMELELLPAKTIFMLYKDSVDLIKFISSKFKSYQHISPNGSTDNKLAVLSLRCQSLLYLKMYNMKKGELRDCQKTYAEYQKSTTASAGVAPTATTPSLRPMPSPSVVAVSSSGGGSVGTVMATGPNGVVGWHPKTTGTPSPMSPLPSPAGSVGSVESQSSGFSSSSDLSARVPANQQQGSGATGLSSATSVGGQPAQQQQQQLMVHVPQTIHTAMRGQLGILNYLYHSMDLWEQADALIGRGRSQDFFSSLDRRCGCLTLHSSLRELVRYIRNGLHWLKGL